MSLYLDTPPLVFTIFCVPAPHYDKLRLVEIFTRKYGERKMSVIFLIFHKNKGNSKAIDRIFRGNQGNLSHFYPSYLSCKGL